MFQYQEKVLYDKTFQFSLMNAGQVLSYRQVLDYWQNNDALQGVLYLRFARSSV